MVVIGCSTTPSLTPRSTQSPVTFSRATLFSTSARGTSSWHSPSPAQPTCGSAAFSAGDTMRTRRAHFAAARTVTCMRLQSVMSLPRSAVVRLIVSSSASEGTCSVSTPRSCPFTRSTSSSRASSASTSCLSPGSWPRSKCTASAVLFCSTAARIVCCTVDQVVRLRGSGGIASSNSPRTTGETRQPAIKLTLQVSSD